MINFSLNNFLFKMVKMMKCSDDINKMIATTLYTKKRFSKVKISDELKEYDFKKTDIVLDKVKGSDEVADIGNALSDLLIRISEYTKEHASQINVTSPLDVMTLTICYLN